MCNTNNPKKGKEKAKQLKDKLTLSDWKKLIIKKRKVKKKEDTQKILHELKYGTVCN